MAKKTDQERIEAWKETHRKGVAKYQEKLKKKVLVPKGRGPVLKSSSSAPKKTQIAKKSATQKKRDKKYYPAKKEFLARPENEMCNMRISPECIENRQPTVDLHHMKGKCGPLYWDMTYFMATCRLCHNYELANDKEAKEKGVSVLRLTRNKIF